MTAEQDRLDLVNQAGLDELPSALFAKRVVERSLGAVRTEHWPTSARSLADLDEPTLRLAAEWGEQRLFEHDGVLVFLGLYGGHARASLAHENEESVAAALAWLRERLPAPDPSSAHEITVTFWTYGPHGPMPSWRAISVPSWNDIRENYAGETREKLEPLMEGFEPARGGQLVLWHGLAGTGKTFALRSLGWEWRDWCEFHYIVDPDSFFGQHADYLMNVLLQPAHMAMGWTGYSLGASSSIVQAVEVDGEQESEDGRAGSCSCSRTPASS
jgi:hypothetical protein